MSIGPEAKFGNRAAVLRFDVRNPNGRWFYCRGLHFDNRVFWFNPFSNARIGHDCRTSHRRDCMLANARFSPSLLFFNWSYVCELRTDATRYVGQNLATLTLIIWFPRTSVSALWLIGAAAALGSMVVLPCISPHELLFNTTFAELLHIAGNSQNG